MADDFILKGSKLVRQEILRQIHVGHMAIEKHRRRARVVVYWPGLNQEIETMVQKSNTCIRFSDHKTNNTFNTMRYQTDLGRKLGHILEHMVVRNTS